jgi:hypothetical protein
MNIYKERQLMAKYHRQKIICSTDDYLPGCGRASVHTTNESYNGQCRVFCYLLTDIEQLTSKDSKSVHGELINNNFDHSVGVYFYRFANDDPPFIKIGECSNRPITKRFSNGWHGQGTDSYIYRGTKNPVTDEETHKPMYRELRKISEENPAYFVFYEMVTEEATPKVDEFVALENHITQFDRSTYSPHSSPRYRTGANLIWHEPAFAEVFRKEFPGGNPYPE